MHLRSASVGAERVTPALSTPLAVSGGKVWSDSKGEAFGHGSGVKLLIRSDKIFSQTHGDCCEKHFVTSETAAINSEKIFSGRQNFSEENAAVRVKGGSHYRGTGAKRSVQVKGAAIAQEK